MGKDPMTEDCGKGATILVLVGRYTRLARVGGVVPLPSGGYTRFAPDVRA